MMKKTLQKNSLTYYGDSPYLHSRCPPAIPFKQFLINQEYNLLIHNFRLQQQRNISSNTHSSSISVGNIDFTKSNKPITWVLGLNILQDTSSAIPLLPNEIKSGNKYFYIVKIVLLNTDSKWGGKVGHTHLMCGTQAFFNYDTEKSINNLLSDVQDKVSITLEEYNYNSELEYVQISFWPLNLNITKKPISSIDNKVKDYNQKHGGDFTIPINTNSKLLGDALDVVYDENGIITDIKTNICDDSDNFLELVNNNIKYVDKGKKLKWGDFDVSWKFYQITYKSKPYILGIHTYNKNTIEKVIFTKSGAILTKVIDHFDENGEFLTRISNNKTIHGTKNKINDISRDMKLSAIPNKRSKSDVHQYLVNSNIGAIDCETFKDSDNITRIYALGFKESLKAEPQIYHINDFNGDSNKTVIKFIDDIMASRLNNITFYCHNWGGYDSVYIIKILNQYNQTVIDKYKMSYYFRDSKVYKLVIQDRFNKNKKVTICDSYTILTSSLSELCRSYEINENKTYFPYSFVSRDTFTYKGLTPARSYYNNISTEIYNDLLSSNWCLYEESKKYLVNDIEILLKILHKVNDQLFEDYNVNISDKGTIAGLATKIFMKSHYKDNIPLINKSTLYNDVKKGYYGGITEVYRPYGENLYYYDVNSLYPSVCLNPMPGVNNSKKIEYLDTKPNIDGLFGFFYCDIETPVDLYIGVLPVRNSDGLIFPLGKFSGWYFSEELKFAKSLGYKIVVHNGYTFEKQYDTFKSYVNKIYSIKNNPVNKTQKAIAKGLLNNLLGRFGISLYKPITKIVNQETFSRIISVNRIVDHKVISDDNILITYYDIIDPSLIEQSGIEFNQTLTKEFEEPSQHTTTSIVISAAVTAYARISISKLKLDILNRSGKIYYSDTDSIITDIKLPSDMVSSTELGKLKLEHKIAKGIFISGKTYCLINESGDFINKAKGVSNTSLTYEDYENLLHNKSVMGEKKTSKMNWSEGDVTISTDLVVLNSDVYKKRIKIHQTDVWFDTKPIVLTNETEIKNSNENSNSTQFNNSVNKNKNMLIKTPFLQSNKRLFSNKAFIFMSNSHQNDSSTIKNIWYNYVIFIKLLIYKYSYKNDSIYIWLHIITIIILLFNICITNINCIQYDYQYPLDYECMYLADISSTETYNISEYISDYTNSKVIVPVIKEVNLLDDSLHTDYSDRIELDQFNYIQVESELSESTNNVDKVVDSYKSKELPTTSYVYFNTEDFKPDCNYIEYVLTEGSGVPEKVYLEDDGWTPPYKIELTFQKDNYKPLSITQHIYSEFYPSQEYTNDSITNISGTTEKTISVNKEISENSVIPNNNHKTTVNSNDDTLNSIIELYHDEEKKPN